MRAQFPLCFLFCFLAACTGPRITHTHYSPPSSVPVRRAVASAQDHARSVKEAIAEARKATDKDQLELALSHADGEVDRLTAELLTAQTALTDFQTKAEQQTTLLNTCGDEKNDAITQRDQEKQKASRASGKLWRTRGLLGAALVWIFRTPLLALGKMILGLVAKI
jgi:hypothetical protein